MVWGLGTCLVLIFLKKKIFSTNSSGLKTSTLVSRNSLPLPAGCSLFPSSHSCPSLWMYKLQALSGQFQTKAHTLAALSFRGPAVPPDVTTSPPPRHLPPPSLPSSSRVGECCTLNVSTAGPMRSRTTTCTARNRVLELFFPTCVGADPVLSPAGCLASSSVLVKKKKSFPLL